jgi:hypothetical protein
MSYSREFIGKGKKIANHDMVQVTICVDQIEEHIREYEGKKYVTFMVASMKAKDKFGRTHSAFISEREKA